MLPADTQRFLTKYNVKIDNYSIRLNKYIEFKDSDFGEYEIENKSHNTLLDVQERDSKVLLEYVEKQKYLLKSYESQGYEVDVYKFRPYDKLIIGLGQESVREFSITLHWIYGIPYIPGQAIKGLVSNWIEVNGDVDDNYKKFFGTMGSKGKVIFMDAYPEYSFSIKRDIMNPHYFDYYTKGSEPADWQNPQLIFFLTVKKAVFRIPIIYLEKNMRTCKISGKTLQEWMKEAFEYGGIGAKTSLGYGTGELRLTGGI